MPRLPAAAVLLLAAAACAPATGAAGPRPAPSRAAQVGAAMDSVFADTALAHAHWGVLVRSLDGGETLFERQADRMFVPASTMKVVTASAALEALGPDFRWSTAVGATGPVEGGVLPGDLVVAGSGDPTLSGRFHRDVMTLFREWADSLRARGVTRVEGRVVGNDDRFDDLPYGAGWAWDDVDDVYSAQVSALELNEGVVEVRVEGTVEAGRPARASTMPFLADVPIENEVVMVRGPSALRFGRGREPGAVRVWGVMSVDSPPVHQLAPVNDPTRFFATVLRETLVLQGIAVSGAAVDADALAADDPARGPAAATLFVHRSPPLARVLPGFLKPSQNQIGELILKTLGAELRGAGTAAGGAAAVDSLHRLWGMPPGALRMADGSGLSRYDLLTPRLLVRVMERMAASPHAEAWRAALPVMGAEGTLARRGAGTPLAGRVVAKTGTMSGVRSLTGYLTTDAGERLVFAAVSNHHDRPAREVDRVVDAALLRLLAVPRGAAAPTVAPAGP
jgi:D-alanyl-D-alanine carboxypeptidase/D-alanyl-D-alanine-endopeptidase (penicillin-binding protein 4)